MNKIQTMAADRGQENPLRTAVEQTSGLTIVRDLPIHKPPYLKFIPGGRDGDIVNLPGNILFVGLEPKSWNPEAANGMIDKVMATLEPEDFRYASIEPRGAARFGFVQIQQSFPEAPVIIETSTTTTTEDPELQRRLQEAHGRESGQVKVTAITYHPANDVFAYFYPSAGIANLAADIKVFESTARGWKPETVGGLIGAMHELAGEYVGQLLINNEQEALAALAKKYMPEVTGTAAVAALFRS